MRDLMRTISQSQSDLTVFHSIIAILESGAVYEANNVAQRKILDICKKETLRQLKKHDAALNKLLKATHP